ncbi:TetR/AcrR family transcriptional regulator [Actinoalloteichus spitiensis]|uniref:TetR/AcrR family transcriptional regulator n=1 Tax=Actinoalloteichus spitiensis TaxID=252394 RepID=UPI0002E4D383|nr:TetR/AcrR family transcriptional regulator [Actinoalloteichus spitiensis]
MPTRRPYHSPRREREALATRQDILRAARELFTARGYGRVTVADIARQANTALKTVYASVGTKSDLLHCLIDSGISQSHATATLEKLRDATSLESAITLVARGTRADHERHRPTIDVLYSAVASDDSARDVWEHMVTLYRGALEEAARQIVGKGFAPRFDVPGVRDRLWFCFGMNAWRTLTVDCEWSYDDAERTLRRQAISILTEPPSIPPGTR